MLLDCIVDNAIKTKIEWVIWFKKKNLDSYTIKAFKSKLKFLVLIINSLGLAVVHYGAQRFGLLGGWVTTTLMNTNPDYLEWDQGSSRNCKNKKNSEKSWLVVGFIASSESNKSKPDYHHGTKSNWSP